MVTTMEYARIASRNTDCHSGTTNRRRADHHHQPEATYEVIVVPVHPELTLTPNVTDTTSDVEVIDEP